MTRDSSAARATLGTTPAHGALRARESGVRRLLVAALLLAGCGTGAEPAPTATLPPSAPAPYDRPNYTAVSQTGVYADVALRTLAAGFEAFSPSYALFADGAEKRRFVALPPGTRIDTRDIDHWVFPVGTRFVKEFWLDGTLLETRLVERYGEGPSDYFMGAFVWSSDGTDAALAPDGEKDVLGTPHDAPAQKLCTACHNGEPGRVLGFSALELGRPAREAGELTLARLGELGRLSDVPPSALLPPPGDELTARAFGYLHANCGHCHNLNGTAWPDTQMVLRLDVEQTVAEETALYGSVVGEPVQYFRDGETTTRVVPGDPAASAVVVRMQARGDDRQMPPLATEIPDETGIMAVSDWIRSLAR